MKTHKELVTVVIAGCSSGVGKTCVAESITSALAQLAPTAAVKITVTHGDRGCPHGGKGCNVCSSLGGDFQVITNDSTISQPGTDTARLKMAGGRPVIWVITRDVALGKAWAEVQALLTTVDYVVVESNSLTGLIEPTQTLMVVDSTVSRKIWKPSAERLIREADYVLFNDRGPKEKSKALLDEIESSRGGLETVIKVSHPHEVLHRPELMQRLKSSRGELVIG